jgi:hypothetical protein
MAADYQSLSFDQIHVHEHANSFKDVELAHIENVTDHMHDQRSNILQEQQTKGVEEPIVELPTVIVDPLAEVQPKEEKPGLRPATWKSLAIDYLNKFRGMEGKKKPPRLPLIEIFYNSLISFIGIMLIAVADYYYLKRTFSTGDGDTLVMMLIGSFGATAVLLFDLYTAPASQPRNCIGGHTISSFIGVSIRLLFETNKSNWSKMWVQAPIAVAASIAVMDLCQCIHPPGGKLVNSLSFLLTFLSQEQPH